MLLHPLNPLLLLKKTAVLPFSMIRDILGLVSCQRARGSYMTDVNWEFQCQNQIAIPVSMSQHKCLAKQSQIRALQLYI